VTCICSAIDGAVTALTPARFDIMLTKGRFNMRMYVAASAAVAVSLILITGLTNSAQGAQSTRAANLDDAYASFQSTTQAYAAALKSADFAKIQSFYAPDISVYAPGMVFKGLAAVQQIQQSDTSDHSKDVFDLFPDNIQVAMSGDIAYTTGTYQVAHADGRPADTGKFVAIWKVQPAGNWALTVDVFNPDLISNPAPLTP
jgi:ketosteroid isomerase-like protein